VYSTCLFCNASLGSNEVIESFPVGRRMAFDAANGRLWVVCRKCERWNLSPLEERWEAIEESERRFRDTRLRVSTDNIGLARLAEGLELVRVGPALRPEFAAITVALSVTFALNLYLTYGWAGHTPPTTRLPLAHIDATLIVAVVNCALFAWFGVTIDRVCRTQPAEKIG